VAATLTLKTGSTCIFKISHAPLTNDVVKIYGRFSLGGALVVTNVGINPLAAGDTFKLFDSTNYTGAVASVQLPPLPVGLAWNTNSLNTNGTVSVVLNTVPSINAIVLSGNGLALSGTGGVGNVNFFVLSATNLATPLSNWTRLLTNQFDHDGNFNFTNGVDTNSPQSFFRLQLP
jgi:hypothetical protein